MRRTEERLVLYTYTVALSCEGGLSLLQASLAVLFHICYTLQRPVLILWGLKTY